MTTKYDPRTYVVVVKLAAYIGATFFWKQD